jgi:hypothetical protein
MVHPEEGILLLLRVGSIPGHKDVLICLSWNPR